MSYQAFNEEDEDILEQMDDIRDGSVTMFDKKKALSNADTYLGVEFSAKKNIGILMTNVIKGSPMHVAGVREADTVTHVGGVFVDHQRDFMTQFKQFRAGDECMIKAIRRGEALSFRVIIGAKGYTEKQILAIRRASCTDGSQLVGLQKVEKARRKMGKMKKALGIKFQATPTDQGLIIGGVDTDGAADIAGLLPKDILHEFEGVKISDSTIFFREFQKLSVGQIVPFTIYRGGSQMVIDVQIGAAGFPLSEVRQTLEDMKLVVEESKDSKKKKSKKKKKKKKKKKDDDEEEDDEKSMPPSPQPVKHEKSMPSISETGTMDILNFEIDPNLIDSTKSQQSKGGNDDRFSFTTVAKRT